MTKNLSADFYKSIARVGMCASMWARHIQVAV